MAAQGKKKSRRPAEPPVTRVEVFEKLNASAERALWALTQAYEARQKEGFKGREEEQLIVLLRRAKQLRDEVRSIASAPPSASDAPKPPQPAQGA